MAGCPTISMNKLREPLNGLNRVPSNNDSKRSQKGCTIKTLFLNGHLHSPQQRAARTDSAGHVAERGGRAIQRLQRGGSADVRIGPSHASPAASGSTAMAGRSASRQARRDSQRRRRQRQVPWRTRHRHHQMLLHRPQQRQINDSTKTIDTSFMFDFDVLLADLV